MTEQAIKRTICDFLHRRGWVVLMYPAHTGAFKQGRYVRYSSPYMPAGVADLILSKFGRIVFGEVKRPKGAQRVLLKGVVRDTPAGRLSQGQKSFRDFVMSRGADYRVLTSVEEAAALDAEVNEKWGAA